MNWRLFWFIAIGIVLLFGLPLLCMYLGDWLFSSPGLGTEIAGLVYSWPVVVVVIAALFMYTFREAIANLIRRGFRYERDGHVIDTREEQRPSPPDTERLASSLGKEPLSAEYESLAEKLAPIEFKYLRSKQVPPESQRYLWFLYWHYERTWLRIYRSQVELLQALKEESVSVEHVKLSFFKTHRVRVMESPDSDARRTILAKSSSDPEAYFREYLSFLSAMELISVDLGKATVSITPAGRGFLGYMGVYMYYPHMKMY